MSSVNFAYPTFGKIIQYERLQPGYKPYVGSLGGTPVTYYALPSPSPDVVTIYARARIDLFDPELRVNIHDQREVGRVTLVQKRGWLRRGPDLWQNTFSFMQSTSHLKSEIDADLQEISQDPDLKNLVKRWPRSSPPFRPPSIPDDSGWWRFELSAGEVFNAEVKGIEWY